MIRVLFANIYAGLLTFMPRYWFWQICKVTETGPAGNFTKIWLVKFGRRGEAPIIGKRLIARIAS